MISKQKKRDLSADTVHSKGFHVGIELELRAPGTEGSREHDDDACYDHREEAQRDYLESLSDSEILREYLGLGRSDADSVAPYFNTRDWISDYMSGWSDDGCSDDECSYWSNNGEEDDTRYDLQSELIRLTGNNSFKVVDDASIKTDADTIAAEVCWNYYASKETLRDNEKILAHLRDKECDFNTSCGLHINLNNYLSVKCETSIPTEKLDFLFNIVAPSRRLSTYCNNNAISGDRKYSMIYEQGDRLEFRFFSPTLEHEKLNHYVTLANVVYRRLAGKTAKLPKKCEDYFLAKMTNAGIGTEVASETITRINSIPSIQVLEAEVRSTNDASEEEVA